ncbi:LOW QUALITY PROTEIN: EF-hand calcium-binding domain-containing protein 6 [Leptosomus discolor]
MEERQQKQMRAGSSAAVIYRLTYWLKLIWMAVSDNRLICNHSCKEPKHVLRCCPGLEVKSQVHVRALLKELCNCLYLGTVRFTYGPSFTCERRSIKEGVLQQDTLCDSMQDAERTVTLLPYCCQANSGASAQSGAKAVVTTATASRRPQDHEAVRNGAGTGGPRAPAQGRSYLVGAMSVSSVPDPALFSWDIGQILLQKAAEKEDELKKAFRMLDVGQTLTVTKDEFRRVIETFLFHLTEAEFDAVLAEKRMSNVNEIFKNLVSLKDLSMYIEIQIPNIGKGTVPYLDFLSKFTGIAGSTSMLKRLNSHSRQKMTLRQLESLLKEKIAKNVKNIIRCCRLFDYTRAGWIQRHTLRKILEITCFRMKDSEFEKLWNRYCVRDSDVIDYKEFLKNFGISTDTVTEKSTENEVPALICQKIKEEEQKQKKLSVQSSPAECAVTECSLDSTERAFKEKLCSAHQDIEKAFRAIDVSRSGFVSLDYLKSVINAFIFPLPNETFQELMNRFGLKATGKIAWQQFLEKFQDPGSTFENKQTIPLRKKHKVNPPRGDEAFSSEPVLQKLHRYIQDAYPSLKQEFLMLDEVEKILSDKIRENWKDFHKALQSYEPKCTGTINRSHLRKVLQLCCPSLSDQQFMKLCYKYKDNSSDGIFYKMLLDNLKVAVLSGDLNGISSHISKEKQQREEKRQTELSKRIKQIEDHANKYAQNRTVDEVIKRLKDRVKQQAATIKDSFYAYNKQSHGKINKAGLRKVLEDHGMPMDDSQFNLLTEKLGLPDGGLSYLDFVAVLEGARLNGPFFNSPNHQVNYAKYHYMTAEECLNQLNDKLREVYGDTYSAFRETDSNHDGIINMLDFRQLLDSFLLRLSNEEFLRLLGLLGMNLTSTLNYQEFCQLFHTQETKEVPPQLMPSHQKKQMIKDAELAYDHAHYYLVIKARTRWHDLARNFQEFDSEGNGIIQPRDLKKVLLRFGIPITPEEFKQLWARYDTDAKGYHQEFLQKLGIEFAPTDTGLSRHITEDSYAHSQVHYNKQKKHSKLKEQQKQQTKALHIREIKEQIKDKFRDYFQDFNKAFHKVDKNKDGYVTVCDLQRILQEFNYYFDHDQFRSLLKSLGISIHHGKLSYFDFLRAIDDGRTSKYQQRQKQAAPPASFAVLSLEQTLIKIKEIVASSYDLLYKAFSLFDKEDTGVIKALEFRQVLDHFCFKLSDKQFRHLLKNLNLCEDFTVDWKVFLKNINHIIETKEGQEVVPPKSSWELSERGILSQIREVVTAGFNTIAQEFKDIDSSKDNTVSKKEFWDICNRHVQQLTEEQASQRYAYVYLYEDALGEPSNLAQKVGYLPCVGLSCHTDLHGQQKQWYQQFENLWNTVDVSAGGRLNYQDFLKKFSSELVTMPSHSPSATSSATSTKPNTRAIPASSRPRTKPTFSAPALNCKTIENKIRKNIQHSWRGILKVCKEKDVSKLGEIPVSDFLGLLPSKKCFIRSQMHSVFFLVSSHRDIWPLVSGIHCMIAADIAQKFSLDLSEGEINQITRKYAFKKNGRFAYYDFLQSCILLLTPQESSLLQRVIIQKPQKPLSPGPQTTSFFSAMLRIQPQILHCWRPMKQTFKSYDESHTGLLNIADFREVLRKYNINLTEEELFNILEYYDKPLSSKISYNDFLWAFVQ